MKQETLEEVALKYAESNQYDLEYHDEGGYQGIDTRIFAKKLIDFTNKWQAERSYSEEEVKSLLNFINDCASNWDCDNDAHRYNTPCRMCEAQKVLQQFKKKA